MVSRNKASSIKVESCLLMQEVLFKGNENSIGLMRCALMGCNTVTWLQLFTQSETIGE